MLSVSLFKRSFCQSDLVLGGGLISCRRCYLCIVDQVTTNTDKMIDQVEAAGVT